MTLKEFSMKMLLLGFPKEKNKYAKCYKWKTDQFKLLIGYETFYIELSIYRSDGSHVDLEYRTIKDIYLVILSLTK